MKIGSGGKLMQGTVSIPSNAEKHKILQKYVFKKNYGNMSNTFYIRKLERQQRGFFFLFLFKSTINIMDACVVIFFGSSLFSKFGQPLLHFLPVCDTTSSGTAKSTNRFFFYT